MEKNDHFYRPESFAMIMGNTIMDIIALGVNERPDHNKAVSATSYELLPGGMAVNVSITLAKLGFEARLFSWINPSDSAGNFIKEKLREFRNKDTNRRQIACKVFDKFAEVFGFVIIFIE